ncbi:MAG: PDGLE domain-containing protein, partial [Chloroflexota bacterium]|nr:PDGLE domain-containing protein [Chloroflexota bacterium]
MGANIVDMGILTALVGGAIFYGLLRITGRQRWGLVASGFIAGLLSVVLAAVMAALQLSASGTVRAAVVLPAMVGVHVLIGIGEGLITAAALAFLLAMRPDLLPVRIVNELRGTGRPVSARGVLTVGVGIAALLALLSPLASASPDGLERVAENLGFLDRGQAPSYNIIPDYAIPGVAGPLSTILAGLVGVLIVVALGYSVATLVRRRRSPERSTDSVSV